MASVLIPASQRFNANVAGQTHVVPNETPPGTPHAAQPTEVVANIPSATGALDLILAGGSHPENIIPPVVATNLTRASDSLAGKMGGLVPRFTGTLAPGPAGAAASARSTLDKIRRRLNL